MQGCPIREVTPWIPQDLCGDSFNGFPPQHGYRPALKIFYQHGMVQFQYWNALQAIRTLASVKDESADDALRALVKEIEKLLVPA